MHVANKVKLLYRCVRAIYDIFAMDIVSLHLVVAVICLQFLYYMCEQY